MRSICIKKTKTPIHNPTNRSDRYIQKYKPSARVCRLDKSVGIYKVVARQEVGGGSG